MGLFDDQEITEIVNMDQKISGSRNCRNGAVSGPRNNKNGQIKILDAITVEMMCFLDPEIVENAAIRKSNEAENAGGQQKLWRLIAGPKVSNKRGLADTCYVVKMESLKDNALLTKMPPTIVWDRG